MRQLRTACRATSSGLAMNSCAHAAPDIFVSVERNFDRCARSATQVKGDRLMRNRPRVPVGPVKAPRASAQPNRPRRCGAPSALSRLRSGEWARRLGMVLHRRDHARPQRSRHAAQRPDPALLLIAVRPERVASIILRQADDARQEPKVCRLAAGGKWIRTSSSWIGSSILYRPGVTAPFRCISRKRGSGLK